MKPSLLLLCLALFLPSQAAAAGLRAGVARIDITPDLPFWLTGYASRSRPATNVAQRISAKALALDDGNGGRIVLVTTDLIGIPAYICEEASAAIRQRTDWRRDQVLFNASHTHAGPMIWANLQVMFDLNPEDETRARDYARTLAHKLTEVASQAVGNLAAAQVAFGQGEAGFATNRREFTPDGVRIGVNPSGAMDHSVPVLRVTSESGKLLAVVFGYACHNTTLGGDCYAVHGDYAGRAQAALEAAHPGTTAMFLMLCGGDQNPHPRGTMELAIQHGEALATEVDRVLNGHLTELAPPIRTGFDTLRVDFAPQERATFETEAESPDRFRQRRARAMLAADDAGAPVRHLPYPIQAVRLGDDLTLLALAGETVVDYALRAKHQFETPHLVVAGYCNDVACYICTRQIIAEGGYEPVSSMIYYGQPGPLADSAEETIFDGVTKLLGRLGVNPR
ncbi:MAG: neutral/alkaline non-lysosomal ceramidase N-terminal domain-containing protein [Verrucomicrobiales bacterium]|nr:neutral/alkaline non-lysosomal ceramidase N-terminal domain-containing protein [Verrucomicrobiales bacterium]